MIFIIFYDIIYIESEEKKMIGFKIAFGAIMVVLFIYNITNAEKVNKINFILSFVAFIYFVIIVASRNFF